MNLKPSIETGRSEGMTGRLVDYESAIKKIKEATGLSDANEIIQKFATQSDTYNGLDHQKIKNGLKLKDLGKQQKQAIADLEQIKFEGLDVITVKKQTDDTERAIILAQQKHDRNYERL